MVDMSTSSYQRGAINGSIIAIVTLSILVAVAGAFGGWAYIQYTDQKTNVDNMISTAKTEAAKEQEDADSVKFTKAAKEPLMTFSGPADYGHLTFQYPKTWSAYQATDIRQGGGVTYYAYLHPVFVPPTTPTDQKFALRIVIEQKTYESVLAGYDKQLKKGDLQSSAWTDNDNGLTGTMLKGNFTTEIRGTAVLIKMRDRTLTVRTDSDIFNDDYKVVLKTLNFNQ